MGRESWGNDPDVIVNNGAKIHQPTMGWYHWNQQFLWFTMGIPWDDVFFFFKPTSTNNMMKGKSCNFRDAAAADEDSPFTTIGQ